MKAVTEWIVDNSKYMLIMSEQIARRLFYLLAIRRIRKTGNINNTLNQFYNTPLKFMLPDNKKILPIRLNKLVCGE